MSLASSIPVLGLERFCPRKGCPWPRIFFVSLASSLVSSTPPLIFTVVSQSRPFRNDNRATNQPRIAGPFGKISRSSLYAFQQVYKEQFLSHPTVSLWHKKCTEEHEDVENDPRCGIIFAQTLRISRSSVTICQMLFRFNPSSSEISRTVNRRSPRTIFFTSSTLVLFLLVEGPPYLGSSSVHTSFFESFVQESNCRMRQSLLFVDLFKHTESL